MKSVIIISLMVAVASGCTREKQYKSTEIVVAHDLTEQFIMRPGINEIWEAVDFQNSLDQSVMFKILPVTDKSINAYMKLTLENAGKTNRQNTGNVPYHRKKVVNAFYSTMKALIDSSNATSRSAGTLPYSEVYRTLINELWLFSESTATSCHLFYYGDLREKSDLWDTYSPPFITASALADTLIRKYPVPDNLTNVTVHFCFVPGTREESHAFSYMVSAYVEILERSGATIKIHSTLND